MIDQPEGDQDKEGRREASVGKGKNRMEAVKVTPRKPNMMVLKPRCATVQRRQDITRGVKPSQESLELEVFGRVYVRACQNELEDVEDGGEICQGSEKRAGHHREEVCSEKATLAGEKALADWQAAGKPPITPPFEFIQKEQEDGSGPCSSTRGILKIPKATWATFTRKSMGKVVSSTSGNAKPTRASGNRMTASDVAIRKNIRPDERRIIFVQDSDTPPLPVDQIAEMTSALNIALHLTGAPSHIRIERIQRSAKGTLTAAATKGATGAMVIKFKDVILKVSDLDVRFLYGGGRWRRRGMRGADGDERRRRMKDIPTWKLGPAV